MRTILVALTVALAAGCSRSPEKAPSTESSAATSEPSMKPSEALARHLKTARPGMDFAPERMAVDIDGWTFFRAARPDERDGGDEFFVVRADGTVVAHGDREAELGKVLAAAGMKGDPVQLARAVLALSTYEETLIDADALPHLSAVPAERAVEPPRIDEGATLVFWSRGQGRQGELIRREVSLRDGRAVVKTERPALRPRP